MISPLCSTVPGAVYAGQSYLQNSYTDLTGIRGDGGSDELTHTSFHGLA